MVSSSISLCVSSVLLKLVTFSKGTHHILKFGLTLLSSINLDDAVSDDEVLHLSES